MKRSLRVHRSVIFFLFVFVFSAAFPQAAFAAARKSALRTSASFVAYNGKTFSSLGSADRLLPLASLTKLMTALVLSDTVTNWESIVQVTDEQIMYPKTLAGDATTSEVALISGDRVSLADLFSALLIASSNQSAVVLSDATGFTREEFVRRMNRKAATLGLRFTKFYDASGLDPRNVGTARDMARLARVAFANPRIAKISVLREYGMEVLSVKGIFRIIPVINRNKSLLAFAPSGAKTGYLIEARHNAVIQKNGKTFVVLHAASLAERNRALSRMLGQRF